MSINKAVADSIKDLLDEIKESDEFKRRFTRLIEQAMSKPLEQAYIDDDIREVLELIGSSEEGWD